MNLRSAHARQSGIPSNNSQAKREQGAAHSGTGDGSPICYRLVAAPLEIGLIEAWSVFLRGRIMYTFKVCIILFDFDPEMMRGDGIRIRRPV